MKTLLLFLCFVPTYLWGQHDKALQALEKGDKALQEEDYRTAVNKYRAAEAYDPKLKNQVDIKIDLVFKAIERKKEEAEREKKRAQNAEKVAQQEKQKTATALETAKKAQQQAETEKQNAQTNLDKANKLINAFYFAYGRFALAFKEEYREFPKYHFIDKNGNALEKLGKWDKAEQFREYKGFAKVTQVYAKYSHIHRKTHEGDYYLDTLGNTYKVVFSFKDLNTDIRALDLDIGNTQIVEWEKILSYTNLEVLILSNHHLSYKNKIPTEIKKMTNFKILHLEQCGLDNLPIEITELKNLTILKLRGNLLKNLPTEIGELKNLKNLNLQDNQFSEEEKARIRQLLPNCTIEF